MWTTAQWMDARRVDHIEIKVFGHKFHPRFRDPDGRPNLKFCDPAVQAFWDATNNFDKVSALGQIVSLASAFIAGFVALPTVGGQDPRYLAPIQGLLAQAVADLNLICGAGTAVARDQDIVALGTGVVPAQKVVLINVFYIAAVGVVPVIGPIDAQIDAQVLAANGMAAFTTARVLVRRNNIAATVISAHNGQSILMTDLARAGKFHEGQLSIFLLISLLNPLVLPGTIDVVFHDAFVDDDVQGFTARVHEAAVYSGAQPAARPIVLVRRTPSPGGDATHPTTLAHEIGHALTTCGQHSALPDDLMAGGANRNGVNLLTVGEMAWFRNNPYAA
jgi:hypothetical protein